MKPFQLNQYKSKLRAAATAFAAKHKTKFKLLDVQWTEGPDKASGEDEVWEVKLVVSPANGGKQETFPVSILHLGPDQDKWVAKFGERLAALNQKLRFGAGNARASSLRDVPGVEA